MIEVLYHQKKAWGVLKHGRYYMFFEIGEETYVIGMNWHVEMDDENRFEGVVLDLYYLEGMEIG